LDIHTASLLAVKGSAATHDAQIAERKYCRSRDRSSSAIGKHVVIVIVPFAGWVARGGAFENEVVLSIAAGYRKKISDGRRQRLILLDSVCCSLDGSKCGLKDCHGKEPNSNDTSEGRPQPVVVERHGDARKQAQ
jgi:hypothetical protein